MKKLVSVMVIAMMLALAFTVAANAEVVWTPQADDGLYDITHDLAADKTGTMYGMVVIEAATEPAQFELTQDNIRYIDQVTANGSTLSFTDVGPMDLKDNGTYYVYIGGGDYTKATKIGTLSETGTTPEPPVTQTFTVTFVADGVTVDTKTVNVGESLAPTAFPDVPEKTGFTGKWNVTTDITSATTVTAVYTEIPVETFTVTFVADGVTVREITKNVGETVLTTEFPDVPEKTGFTGKWNVTTDITSATTVTAEYTAVGGESTTKKGDIDGSGKVNSNDAIYLLEYTFDNELPVHANTDVDGSGKTNSNDAIYLLEYTFDDSIELH